MNSYLHPEKLVPQNTEEALTHIFTFSALEISSGILDKGSLMVPVQFTGAFIAVTKPSQTSFPPAPQQLLIIGKQMRTLSFKRCFFTGKHMVGRNSVQLLHAGPERQGKPWESRYSELNLCDRYGKLRVWRLCEV